MIEVKCTFCENIIHRNIKNKNNSNYYCNNKCQANHRKQLKIDDFNKTFVIKCGVCKEVKHFSNFNKNKSNTLGCQTICKKCSRERSRYYYSNNSDTHRLNVSKRNKKIYENIRLFIVNHLLNNPCVDCGESDIRTLHFDHIDPKDKLDDISNMVRRRIKKEVILKEIEKCEVRCANCHAKRTSVQFNWFKNLFISS